MDDIIIEDIKIMEIKEKTPPKIILEGDGIDESDDAYKRVEKRRNETKTDRIERIEDMAIVILVAIMILLLISMGIDFIKSFSL